MCADRSESNGEGRDGSRSVAHEAPWRRPSGAQQLHAFVARRLGLRVPTRAVCKGHDAPMDFLAHGFKRDWYGSPALVWACRGGSKTMLAAALTVLESAFTPGLETRILGGSLAQSGYMYDYVCGFLRRPEMADLVDAITRSRATLNNGSVIEILPASERTVRGVHVPRLRIDEVDEIRDDLLQAALFLPQSSAVARARVDILSTLHRPYGIMGELVDDHEARGLRLFRWCLWEIIENCRGRSCSTCPLDADCRGKAQRADGYFRIDDAIARKRLVSDEAWQSEMLCMRPNREGLVYKAWDESVHVAREPVPYDPGLPLCRAFDWGVNGPTVCLWIQVDGDGCARVIDELYQSGMAVSDMAQGVRAWEESRGYGNVEKSYCDPSGLCYRMEFEKAGMFCDGRREDGGRINVRYEGFEAVRRALKLNDWGRPRLLVSPSCLNVRREFRAYRYPETPPGFNPTEEPAKVNDHAMDALRYFFVARFPRDDWRMV